MKSTLSALAALLVIAGLLWLLLSPGEAPEEAARFAGDDTPAGRAPGEDALTAEATDPGLAGRGRGARRRPRRHHDPMKSYKERTGTLEVVPVDPDGEVVSADACTVSLERVRPPQRMGKLGFRDRQTGVWRFEKVPIGKIRVIVTGDHLVEARRVVRVREATTTRKEVPVEQGGLVHYKAELPTGEAPALVTLTLIQPNGRPADVYWQVRAPRLLTSARRAKQVRQHAEGVVFGVRPGRYRLRAQTDDEFEAEEEIVVAPKDSLEVTLHLRR